MVSSFDGEFFILMQVSAQTQRACETINAWLYLSLKLKYKSLVSDQSLI